MTRPPSIVVVLSDEHAAAATGAYGHPVVRTPNLDRLAEQGLLFENAYCTSPMCVPSRLSLLSGRYVHEIDAWDNGVVPDASFRSWGHHLRPAGYESVLVGRTHFNGPDRLLGFDRRLSDDLDFWVDHDGRPPARTPGWRRGSNSHVTECGAGEHVHTRHDVATTDQALDHLRQRATDTDETPFLLYVGYMHPHFPLVAPREFAGWYDPAHVPLPPTWQDPPEQQHPVIARLRYGFHNEEPLSPDQVRLATASYWALVSHLDSQVGRLLAAIDGSRLRENTVVVYTSDHGEMAGHHGIWQKQCFYEPAVRVPLLLRLPGHRAPARVTGDVSLVDLLPTLRDLAGLPVDPELPGRSLCGRPDLPPRPAFAEYHAQGMVDGGFMLKRGRYKYCSYVGHRPQLFDLDTDPWERTDLADDPAYADLLADLAGQMERIVSPDVADRRAKADQRRRLGG
ncbi:sulfatase-like hydrolase/transferase [Pseudonocardia kunmingensis]|uniref:Choline-sulfatase n=1 Tax=Pseudonocardia kunmingensis TaxID=630975 RepID=A0A543DNN6_9PSEU|nr:sulfatase-like hydrolase/transferase [Pseudonocardia kunmingensis]TQM10903.1 choline-sulfatase [Pseudonocardia kunmingensis]